jgi:hypothetical protein
MATNTASIEKVVRKVLDEEFEQRNDATLEAIERMSRVLTEEVIPRLPDDDADAGYDEDEPTEGNGRARAMRAGHAKPGIDDPADEPDTPEDEDELPQQSVPEAVSEAFEALYASLTAEQANALAELFAAIAEDPADEADESDAPPAERRTHRRAQPRARLAA